MNKTTKAVIVGVAMTGLLAGTSARLHASTPSSSSIKAGIQLADSDADTNSCKGQNSCKGKGGCKTGDNGCKGQNSCKGKGGCKTDGTSSN